MKLKNLVEPDKQLVPTDSKFKGFSFVKRNAQSPKNSQKLSSESEVNLSPKRNSSKFSDNLDRNAQKRAQLAKLWVNLNKYLASPKKYGSTDFN